MTDSMDFSTLEHKLCRATGLTVEELREIRYQFNEEGRRAQLIPHLVKLAEARGHALVLMKCGKPGCESCEEAPGFVAEAGYASEGGCA